jgi:hypothetical protein
VGVGSPLEREDRSGRDDTDPGQARVTLDDTATFAMVPMLTLTLWVPVAVTVEEARRGSISAIASAAFKTVFEPMDALRYPLRSRNALWPSQLLPLINVNNSTFIWNGDRLTSVYGPQ